MKPHSTCSKAVFATLVGCPTGRFTFPRTRAEEGGAHGSVARARASGSSLSSGKGQTRPQATRVTEYRCTLGVDVQPTGLKPRSTQGIWDSLCPRTRKLQPSPFCEGSSAMKGQYIWSVRWYGLIERVQLPKPTRPSLSHFHYTLRSPASTQASARTC
jgi:hypothetical protein